MVPLTLTVVGVVVLVAWPCAGRGCVEPSLGAWLLILFAFPTALAAGLPWFINPVTIGATLVSSLALWTALGALAARRAARQPEPRWTGFAIEMLTLTAGVIGGVLLGFAVIAFWVRL